MSFPFNNKDVFGDFGENNFHILVDTKPEYSTLESV